MLLLVDSKNIYKNTWGSKAPIYRDKEYKVGNVTFDKVSLGESEMTTYDYTIDLNDEIRNAASIRLVDYSISKPDTIEMKDYPSFILKVNDYQLVTHHRYKNIFKSIPFSKFCECDVKNSKYHFDNSNNVIRSIHIQICKIDQNSDKAGTCQPFVELDQNHDPYHNSFLFEITETNYGETVNRFRS